MRILVTGASGLVGGRLLASLARDGRVTVRAASRVARPWSDDVEGAVIDAAHPATVAAACAGVDAVVNLASMSERECAADPEAALRANVGGTLALVRGAMDAGVARFVQLSTIKVYGADPTGSVTEETPTHPASHYAITHRAAEDYAAMHPGAVVLRLANGFGAPATAATPAAWSLIVNDFCRQAATTGRITLQGNGAAWRNFVPLDDVTHAIRAATETLPAGTYNLGARDAMTIRAMADRVARVAGETLGAPVAVSVGAPAGSSRAPLDFRTDRLRAAGVDLTASIDDEIARTIVAARTVIPGSPHA